MKLRISKSNFMNYDFCKYLYKKIVIDNFETEPTMVMLRGTELHKYYEDLVIKGRKNKLSFDDEETIDIVNNINIFEENQKELLKEFYKPIIYEEKFTKVINIDGAEITLVGKPDAVFLEEDNTLNIMEIKTGIWKDYKLSKIRKELVFYSILLEGQTEQLIKNISWFYPKMNHFDTEEIKKRTVTAVYKQLNKMIESHKNDNFESSYNYKKCENCSFLQECVFRS